MSQGDFKKWSCRHVESKGQEPQAGLLRAGGGSGGHSSVMD